jgi:hypothetical protein
MKFTKGLVVGSLITAGIVMMCADSNMMNKNKMMKKGRKLIKKMGIV